MQKESPAYGGSNETLHHCDVIRTIRSCFARTGGGLVVLEMIDGATLVDGGDGASSYPLLVAVSSLLSRNKIVVVVYGTIRKELMSSIFHGGSFQDRRK